MSLVRNTLIGFLALIATGTGAFAERPEFETKTISLSHDGTKIEMQVEIAASFEQRQYGLMNRETLPANTGMLFVFPKNGYRSFWMKNTFIPLDMLFFDADGMLVTIMEDVPPQTLEARRSSAPARYVLEINGGEARRRGWDETIRLIPPY